MTRKKSDINRPDKRIGATIETLAYLFDVSVPTVVRAVKAGNVRCSEGLFGVKLYHVATVEKAVFGTAASQPSDVGTEADPYLEALKDAPSKTRGVAA